MDCSQTVAILQSYTDNFIINLQYYLLFSLNADNIVYIKVLSMITLHSEHTIIYLFN